MLVAIIAVLVGWVLSLVGLNDLLNHLMGLSDQGYYIGWFATGVIIWISNLFDKKVSE